MRDHRRGQRPGEKGGFADRAKPGRRGQGRLENARRGIETSERLGRYRQKIERTIARCTGYRRLTIHYERKAQDRHVRAAIHKAASSVAISAGQGRLI